MLSWNKGLYQNQTAPPAASLTSTRIPIYERVELPEERIPDDSRVEIDAKITAGELSIASGWSAGLTSMQPRLLYCREEADGGGIGSRSRQTLGGV